MTLFSSPDEELAATQAATEQLLQAIAASGKSVSERDLARLDKLASACGRLAYPNDLPLSESAHNLVVWCDHLDDAARRAEFIGALKSYPLRSPWPRA